LTAVVLGRFEEAHLPPWEGRATRSKKEINITREDYRSFLTVQLGRCNTDQLEGKNALLFEPVHELLIDLRKGKTLLEI